MPTYSPRRRSPLFTRMILVVAALVILGGGVAAALYLTTQKSTDSRSQAANQREYSILVQSANTFRDGAPRETFQAETPVYEVSLMGSAAAPARASITRFSFTMQTPNVPVVTTPVPTPVQGTPAPRIPTPPPYTPVPMPVPGTPKPTAAPKMQSLRQLMGVDVQAQAPRQGFLPGEPAPNRLPTRPSSSPKSMPTAMPTPAPRERVIYNQNGIVITSLTSDFTLEPKVTIEGGKVTVAMTGRYSAGSAALREGQGAPSLSLVGAQKLFKISLPKNLAGDRALEVAQQSVKGYLTGLPGTEVELSPATGVPTVNPTIMPLPGTPKPTAVPQPTKVPTNR